MLADAVLCGAFLSKKKTVETKSGKAPSVNDTYIADSWFPRLGVDLRKRKPKICYYCQNTNLKTWKILAGLQDLTSIYNYRECVRSSLR